MTTNPSQVSERKSRATATVAEKMPAQTNTINSPLRPMTGKEYIDSIRDGREIYLYGDRVKDVTTHPAFRNSVRMTARLYDALHDPKTRDVLTCPTDTGSGGYTMRFFRSAHSAKDLVGDRDAIAAWARLTYAWMGRSPDYKASFLGTLGANAEFYDPFQENARRWYRESQEKVLYWNHAIIHPPVDRNRPPDEVADVFVHVEEERDNGLIVSGAKVIATRLGDHPSEFHRALRNCAQEKRVRAHLCDTDGHARDEADLSPVLLDDSCRDGQPVRLSSFEPAG